MGRSMPMLRLLAVVAVLKQRMAQRIELNPSEVTTSLTKRDAASIT